MSNTPIYDQVATDQGWSPDQLNPRFDLTYFLWDSRMKVAASRMLRNRDATIIRFPIRGNTEPGDGSPNGGSSP
jgi:hypothetical protein